MQSAIAATLCDGERRTAQNGRVVGRAPPDYLESGAVCCSQTFYARGCEMTGVTRVVTGCDVGGCVCATSK